MVHTGVMLNELVDEFDTFKLRTENTTMVVISTFIRAVILCVAFRSTEAVLMMIFSGSATASVETLLFVQHKMPDRHWRHECVLM